MVMFFCWRNCYGHIGSGNGGDVHSLLIAGHFPIRPSTRLSSSLPTTRLTYSQYRLTALSLGVLLVPYYPGLVEDS